MACPERSSITFKIDPQCPAEFTHKVKMGSRVTTLPSIAGLVPTSISTNGFTAGGAQAWTQCGSQTCRMQFAFPATNFTAAIGADAFGVTVTSSGNVFWGDAAGVHRQSF